MLCCFRPQHWRAASTPESGEGASTSVHGRPAAPAQHSELQEAVRWAFTAVIGCGGDALPWHLRLSSALDAVGSILPGVTGARLFVPCLDGSLGWAFSPDGVGQPCTFASLKRCSPQDASVLVLRNGDVKDCCSTRCAHSGLAASCKLHSGSLVFSDDSVFQHMHPAHEPLTLLPHDVLALPVADHTSQRSGALLLTFGAKQQQQQQHKHDQQDHKQHAREQRQQEEPVSAEMDGTSRTTLSPSDLGELQRLAQFLCYGLLLNAPQQAGFIAQVSGHLHCLSCSPSLHDALCHLLDALADLLTARLTLPLHPVLAAAHGHNEPAVLFARKPGTAGALPRSNTHGGASELPLTMASPFTSAGPPTGSPGTGHVPMHKSTSYSMLGGGGSAGGATWSSGGAAGAGPGAGVHGSGQARGLMGAPQQQQRGSLSLTSVQLCVPAEVPDVAMPDGGQSSVRAVRTALTHTLLQQVLRTASAAAAASSDIQSSFGTLNLDGRPQASPSAQAQAVAATMSTMSTLLASGTGSATGGTPARAVPALHSTIVPNTSAHLLDEQQPVRDVLLCSSVAGCPAGALLLCAEVGGTGACGQGGPSGHIPSCSGATFTSCSQAGAGRIMGLLDSGNTAGAAAQQQEAAGAAVSCCPGAGQGPSLALYLLHAEPLPVGVMQLVAAEAQALLPLLFGAFRAVVESPRSPCGSQWRQLLGQLTGRTQHPAPTNGAAAANAGTNPCQLQRLQALHSSSTVYPMPPASPPTTALGQQAAAADLQRRSSAVGGVPPAGGSEPLRRASSGRSPSSWSLSPLLAGLIGKAGPGKASRSASGNLTNKGMLPAMASSTARASRGAGSSSTGNVGLGGGDGAGAGAGRTDGSNHHAHYDKFLLSMGTVSEDDALGGGEIGIAPSERMLETKPSEWWLLGSSPEVRLEEGADAVTPLELMVTSMRSRIVEVAADADAGEEARNVQDQDLAAVQLLDVLGRGGQGVVFRGTLHGLETAVKVLTDGPAQQPRGDKDRAAAGGGDGGGAESDGAPTTADAARRMRLVKRGAMEAAVTATLSHPNIVQVYATFSNVVVVRCHFKGSDTPEVRLCWPGDAVLGGSESGPLNQVLCLEYCDAGTLMHAARCGAFRLPHGAPVPPTWPSRAGWPCPDAVPLYTSLLEVALALRYLHARRLVHCDIKADNVLLRSSNRDPRGWTCKLSDYGCARMLTEYGPGEHDGTAAGAAPQYFRTETPIGTLAYMAPESFVKGACLGPSVDIYAFGILMWEVMMCRTPHQAIDMKELPRQVMRTHLRPTFHPLAPQEYVALASRCWSSRPQRRPTAIELVSILEQLLSQAQAQAAGSSGTGAGMFSRQSGGSPLRSQPVQQPGARQLR